MRKLTLLIALFVCSLLHANDIIILRNSTRIDAIITEVSDETVKYHKASNPDGPIFVTNTSEISSIVYDNGEVQSFHVEKPAVNNETSQSSQPEKKSKLYNSGQGAHFQGMVDLGFAFTDLSDYIYYYGYSNANGFYAGPSLDFTFGSRIRDYIFVGGGVGFNTILNAFNKDYSMLGVIHANARGYLPLSETTMPYLDFSIGTSLGVYSMEYFYCRFYTRVGLGVEYKHFDISFGYELMTFNFGYLRLGARF